MHGVKVHAVLKKWDFISYDHCSFCRNSETLEHCFFTCQRLGKVWNHFHPFLLKPFPLSLSFKNLIFLSGSPSDPKAIVFSFIVKTILYEIWISHNRATFRTKHDTPNAIIQNVHPEISFRIKHEFDRLRIAPFEKLWAVNQCLCEITDDGLLKINV